VQSTSSMQTSPTSPETPDWEARAAAIRDAPSPDWEARAAAIRDAPDIPVALPTAPTPMRQPQPPPLPQQLSPPEPPKVLKIGGSTMKVHFFGVAHSGWNLGPSGIGIKMGATGKGEFSYFDVIPLDIDLVHHTSTVKALIGYLLKSSLNLSESDHVGTKVKVIKNNGVVPGRAPPTELFGPADIVEIEHTTGRASVELMIYVRSPVLHAARAQIATDRWKLFIERAEEVVPGKTLSKSVLAAFVGHGRQTIDAALNGLSQPGPNKTLDHLESLMRTHFDSDFCNFAVAFAVVELKNGKDKGKSPGPSAGETAIDTGGGAKRMRTNIPTLAGIFIDAYLMQYVETKSDARKGLVSSIKKAMDMQDPSWALTEMIIATRLATVMKRENKSKKARDAAATTGAVADI
jgi:hypothetical protein